MTTPPLLTSGLNRRLGGSRRRNAASLARINFEPQSVIFHAASNVALIMTSRQNFILLSCVIFEALRIRNTRQMPEGFTHMVLIASFGITRANNASSFNTDSQCISHCWFLRLSV